LRLLWQQRWFSVAAAAAAATAAGMLAALSFALVTRRCPTLGTTDTCTLAIKFDPSAEEAEQKIAALHAQVALYQSNIH